MKENLKYKPTEYEKPEITVEKVSANDPIYGEDDFVVGDYIIAETIVADDEFAKPPRLTREDFSEEAIIARKKAALNNNPQIEVKPIIETVIADDSFNQHRRLTREDFTPEAIMRAKGEVIPKVETTQKSEPIQYPEYFKIEKNLRVNEIPSAQVIDEPLPTPKRLTRADFPGTGSAKMPELVYKKDFIPAPKKSFFRRIIPNFISKWFG